MQISNLIHQYNNNLAAGSEIQGGVRGVSELTSTVSKLAQGQVFEGSITDISGEKVTISLSNGQSIGARLDSGITLNIGESLFFQVKSNDGNLVQIKPMLGESFTNPTLLKALESANLPVNEKTLNMVDTMMKESMPIDSASLSSMYRNVSSFPAEDASNIILMQKLDIPINKEMVEQFTNYKSNENAILNSVGELADSLPKLLSNPDISTEEVILFQNRLVSLVQLKTEEEPVNSEGIKPDVTENLDKETTNTSLKVITDAFKETEQSEVSADNKVINQSDGDTLKPISVSNEQNKSSDIVITSNDNESIVSNPDNHNASISNVLSKTQYNSLNAALKELTGFKEANPEIFDDKGNVRSNLTSTELVNAFNKFLNNSNLSKDDILKLLNNDGYKATFKDFLSDKWSVTPDELKGKDVLPKLYEKLEVHMKQLEELANEITKNPNNIFSKTTNNVRNNIEFMNNLNQYYNYVQIPLRMNGGNATGDLYVYSNKKNSYEDGDEITAFLHFDLENLGSTDISVKMINRKVDTQFYLDNDESYDLIAANAHILDAKLQKKGYNCTIDVYTRENEPEGSKPDFVHQIMKQDVKDGGVLHRYSFDMRA